MSTHIRSSKYSSVFNTIFLFHLLDLSYHMLQQYYLVDDWTLQNAANRLIKHEWHSLALIMLEKYIQAPPPPTMALAAGFVG